MDYDKTALEQNLIATLAENGCSEKQSMAILEETLKHIADYESNLVENRVRQGEVQPMQTAESLEQKIKEFADIYGLECPNNDGNCGTIAEHGCNGTPEDCERTCPIPVQCEFCYTEPRSKFNLINDLKEMIGGLSA
ncbi:MAG: hypothetical protein ABIG69_06700 [Bacteroidota bacterium]